MNHFLTLYFVLLTLPVYTHATDQVILSSGWKFITGDQPGYSDPAFNDDDWISILPGGYWDYLHDNDYDGYAWYRIRFFLPEDMKKGLSVADSLYFYLGKIDDNDETYLNGTVIGRNTRNVPPGSEGEFANIHYFHDIERTYSLPLNSDLIKWGSVNCIAIRVYDIWYTGGMFCPKPRVYTKRSWDGKISVRRNTKNPFLFKPGEESEVRFIITNHDEERPLRGTFITDIYSGTSDQPVFTDYRDFATGPCNEETISFTFPHLVEDFYHVSFKLIEKESSYSFTEKHLFAILRKDINMRDKPVEPIVNDKIPSPFSSLNSADTKILGYLGERMDVNTRKGLKEFPLQLVEPYFTHVPPPWPTGEFLGKLVHGGIKMMEYHQNPELFEVLQSEVLSWISYQGDDGYVGTYPPDKRWETWDAWDHKYVMLGLLEFYRVTGYEPALISARRIGDLISESFGEGEGQISIVENGPNMGMASGSILEPMVYLYKYTGEQKYLDFCNYILRDYEQEKGPKIVSELTKGSGTVYKVGNGKGYEMLSCIIGLVQMYKLTADDNLYRAALNAWDDISRNRLYITGTATEFEHFQETGQLNAGKDDHMGEGCVTAHWIYLSKELFRLTGQQKYLDEIEKSLYNHLLAAQHPVSGDIVYYTALQDEKYYMPLDIYLGPPLCCHASVKRCIAEFPELSFYQHENEIGINIYNASGIKTYIDGMTEVGINMAGDFPSANEIRIKVKNDDPVSFVLALRVPDWTENFTAVIGKEKYHGIPGEFLKIDRKWMGDEIVDVNMDFPVKVFEGGKSYPGYYAIKYGSRVLAVDAQVNNLKEPDSVRFLKNRKPILEKYKGELPANWVGEDAWVSNVILDPDGKKMILVPFAESGQTGGDIRVWIKKN